MLHNDVAQQRPVERPASAPKASQNSPRAQTAAKFKVPTLRQADSRHEDTATTGLRDGSMATMHPIHIHGSHSPPSLEQLTAHDTRPRPQYPEGVPASPEPKPTYQTQPARYHSFGKGHVQAYSVFGPELGTVQYQPSCQEAEAKLQHPQMTTIPPHKSMPTPQPTRHHPSGGDTCRPAQPLGWNKARSNNSCSVRRLRQCCNTHKAGRKFLQCPYYKVYDTILSGMDTGTAAQSSDLRVGRRHNGQTDTGPETCMTSATMASQHKNWPRLTSGDTGIALQIPTHTPSTTPLQWDTTL